MVLFCLQDSISHSHMDMEVSVPGSGFGEDAMSVVSVEVVAAAKVIRRYDFFFFNF